MRKHATTTLLIQIPYAHGGVVAGRRQEAFAAVPDEMADETALLGPPARIRERLEAWKKSPVTTLMVTARDKDTLRLFAEAVL